jgi:hypothetical protein
MKVIINIPNVLYEEKRCDDFLECLEIYTRYLIEYQKQLGLCYGSNYLWALPTPGRYRNECEKEYEEGGIKKKVKSYVEIVE